MRFLDRIKRKLARPLTYHGIAGNFSQPNAALVLKNTHIHPYSGLFLQSDKRLVAASAFHDHKVEKLVSVSRSIRIIKSQVAAVIGHGPWENYYHWYIDSLPRLFGLRDVDVDIELFVSRVLAKEEKQLLFALAGNRVKVRFVSRFKWIKVETAYYLPFLSQSCNAELPHAYLSYYRQKVFKLFPQSPPVKPFKLFISRMDSRRRVFSNQIEVEVLLKTLGYTILQLEKLSFSQQVYYFRFATKVIASHGAGLTNLLYASHCSVLEIFHSDEILNHYEGLCRAAGLLYDYMCLDGKNKDETVLLPVNYLMERINSISHY